MLRLAAFDPIHKLLQLVPVRHPVDFTGQVRKFPASLLEGVSLVRFVLHPFLNNLAGLLAAYLEDVLDINPMPENPVDQTVQRQLARPELCLGGGERVVGNCDFLVCNRHGRKSEYGLTPERTLGFADSAVREAELGIEFVVTLVVNSIGEGLCIAAHTLHWIDAEDQAQCGEIVRTHGHHGAAGEVVIEVDVVLRGCPPRYHGSRRNVDHVGGVDQGPEERPGGVESIVKGFQKDRRVGLGQFGQPEEDFGLGGVGHAWLLEKDMLAGADGADGPLVVQTVG